MSVGTARQEMTMTEAYNLWFWVAMGYVLMVILALAFVCGVL
jgi:hypothetical protein